MQVIGIWRHPVEALALIITVALGTPFTYLVNFFCAVFFNTCRGIFPGARFMNCMLLAIGTWPVGKI